MKSMMSKLKKAGGQLVDGVKDAVDELTDTDEVTIPKEEYIELLKKAEELDRIKGH